ncbi:hypothetical protein H6784_04055 [Candidatus Nomurabacteria bacterium]|nr:hypothetical protein [Candidatus Kaiserbacteria bacterium]MCB9814561.1 hypothetical protein [Candidatus Nomurabacteria bacterium]
MKRFSEQLHKKAMTVKLQAAEKNELRERLVSYMEYHPLPAELKTVPEKNTLASKVPIFAEPFRVVTLPFSIIFKSSAVAAALVLIVIPFVAEKAVPGDTLYAVKVGFNEGLRSTLTFDSYQKVEWETKMLNRRIAEVHLLESEGRLTDEIEAEVAEAVKTHTENAQREIEALRTEDADAATIASIAFDTTLEVQSNSLRNGEGVDVVEGDLEAFSSRGSSLIAGVIDKSRSESEAKNASTTLPSYDKLMARVEQNTTRIYELLDSIKQTTDSTQLVDVTRRIEDIERSIQAVIEQSDEDGVQARKDLVGILQRTQKLIVFVTELDISNTVDIETLVPVVMTEAEELAVTERMTNELNTKLEKIELVLATMKEGDVKAKVKFAVNSITESSVKMGESTEFTNFEAIAKDALVLANDTITLLEQNKYNLNQSIESETASSTEAVGGRGTTTASSTIETPVVESVSTERGTSMEWE